MMKNIFLLFPFLCFSASAVADSNFDGSWGSAPGTVINCARINNAELPDGISGTWSGHGTGTVQTSYDVVSGIEGVDAVFKVKSAGASGLLNCDNGGNHFEESFDYELYAVFDFENPPGQYTLYRPSSIGENPIGYFDVGNKNFYINDAQANGTYREITGSYRDLGENGYGTLYFKYHLHQILPPNGSGPQSFDKLWGIASSGTYTEGTGYSLSLIPVNSVGEL